MINFCKKRLRKQVLIILSMVMTLLVIILHTSNELNGVKTSELEQHIYNKYTFANLSLKQNNEWEELNEAFLIRIPTAIYIVDKSQINLLILTNSEFKTQNFSCYLIFNNQNFIKVNYSLKVLDGNSKFSVFLLRSTQISISNHDNDKKYNLIFLDENRKTRIRREIPLKLKKKPNNISNTALCTDFYILDESYFENFKWWIEINKHLGYKKLIFFNHTIPQAKYPELFKKYQDFIVIKSYAYIPNMNEGHFEYIHPNKMDEVPNFTIHEIIAYNECVMDHFDRFKRIAVYDADEFIIPKADCTPKNFNFKSNLCNIETNFNEICGEDNIDSYLDRISHKNYHLNGSFSYFFPFIGALHNEYMDSLFSILKIELNKTSKFEKKIQVVTTNKKDNNKNFEFFIETQDEYDHAKYLLQNYITNGYKYDYFNLKDDIVFNRIFLLSYITNGKCIHEFETFYPVWHHGNSDNILTLQVPYERGYVVHFRKHLNHDYKYKNYSINNLSVDLNYLNCYLKDIERIISH